MIDVVVIGGGAAGLNGALMLARSRRSVLVLDSGQPRNAPAKEVHGLLGRDGMAPRDLLSIGRDEVRKYGGEVRDIEVKGVTGSIDNFAVKLADDTTVMARRIMIATGVNDHLPNIPGLREHWGTSVLHCPNCHGWEARDKAIGVLASHDSFMQQVVMWNQLSKDVVLLLHDRKLTDQDQRILRALKIPVKEGRVAEVLQDDNGVTGVRLENGKKVARTVIAAAGTMEARIDGLIGLPLTLAQHPSGISTTIKTEGGGKTAVPGVWAAGNAVDPGAQLGGAAASGASVGSMIGSDLNLAELQAMFAPKRRR